MKRAPSPIAHTFNIGETVADCQVDRIVDREMVRTTLDGNTI
jgi:hypothetical protein